MMIDTRLHFLRNQSLLDPLLHQCQIMLPGNKSSRFEHFHIAIFGDDALCFILRMVLCIIVAVQL